MSKHTVDLVDIMTLYFLYFLCHFKEKKETFFCRYKISCRRLWFCNLKLLILLERKRHICFFIENFFPQRIHIQGNNFKHILYYQGINHAEFDVLFITKIQQITIIELFLHLNHRLKNFI